MASPLPIQTAPVPPSAPPLLKGINALVLAGASGGPARQGLNKNYFLLRRKPVVQFALDALTGAGFARTFLQSDLARTSELQIHEETEVLPSASQQSQNLDCILEALGAKAVEQPLLIVFGDTPLLRLAWIKDFVQRCARRPAGIHFGLVPQAFVGPYLEKYPEHFRPRLPFATREYWARPGCLALLRPRELDTARLRRCLDTAMTVRKQNPSSRLWPCVKARARLLKTVHEQLGARGLALAAQHALVPALKNRGLGPLAESLKRRLPHDAIPSLAHRLLDCTVRVEMTPYGAANLDVDDEESLFFLESNWTELAERAEREERQTRLLSQPAGEAWPAAVALSERKEIPRLAEQRKLLLAEEARLS